ncbi:MAG: NAD(P)/FAD-dependent oxidoreductase [Pelolinea sp.]|nr:NAD(P)/FAD-dependent oxidoreductase [Pelolinea sp.]
MNINKPYDVIVIGTGAAGLMAAGQASIAGAKTFLLEKTDAPGKKLSITGKTRCNLTNTADLHAFIDHFGPEGRFLHQAFGQFFRNELLEFFNSIGVTSEAERGGRIFPSNGDAAFVTQQLYQWAQNNGVRCALHSPVEKLVVENGQITAVETRDEQIIPTKSVILCTGGSTFTGTGSTGDGYRMAQSVGHTIIPLRPALVPLKTAGPTAKQLQGLSLRNIKLSVFFDGKKKIEAFGEMLFTHFGISGPIVLTHSGAIVDAIRVGKQVNVSIDLKPALDEAKLDVRLLRELDQGGKQHFQTMLKRLLPAKMIAVCADLTNIPPDRLCHQITAQERKHLLNWLKDFKLDVIGPLSLETGMVTMGGVSLKEVDPKTMMSKIVDGLFFAGEVLDLAGDTGGFNLQAAWSTGWLAGQNAAAHALAIK